jgi:hypothetical protein
VTLFFLYSFCFLSRKDNKSFFNDLWRLNGDRTRGAPSKEYKERERSRDLLVASYVSSYDVDDEVLEDNRSGPEEEEEE